MNYEDKYIKYKTKYLELNQIGGGNKCKFSDTDEIVFGNGGSSAIIVITEDKTVYKFFTIYYYKPNLEVNENIKNQKKRVNNEIKIYELLTKNIINKNISNHIVKYKGLQSCSNAKLLFSECPKSYVEFMNLVEKEKSKIRRKI